MVQIKIATINLRNNSDRWQERRHLLVKQLGDTAPELIGLQEVHMPTRQGQWLCKQINKQISGSTKEPYQLVLKRKQHAINGLYEGVGVLSQLPILYSNSIGLGYGGRVALRVHVELPNHKTMDFVSTHLHHVTFDKEAREEQAMQLVGWLQSHKQVPLQVVVGDFNEEPQGLAIQYMLQSFRSAYRERYGREPLATFPTALYPTDGPAVCLDYLFISTAVPRVIEAKIFCDRAAAEDETLFPSDHVGLVATLEI